MRPAPLGPVAAAMRRMGYRLDGRTNVPNLVGIRGEQVPLVTPLEVEPFPSPDNTWNDYVGLVYFDGVMWHEHLFSATTDPGNIAANGRGTAVMKPGQYVDAYQTGTHRKGTPSEHHAIVNWGLRAPDYWRILRPMGVIGVEVVGEGNEYIGLNIHRARGLGKPVPEQVGPFSAGCQVIEVSEDWTWFIDKVTFLSELACSEHALDYMTYTLLMLSDVTEVPPAQGSQLRSDGTISLIPKEDK